MTLTDTTTSILSDDVRAIVHAVEMGREHAINYGSTDDHERAALARRFAFMVPAGLADDVAAYTVASLTSSFVERDEIVEFANSLLSR